MSVAGKYECVTRSPMGDQTSILTVEVDGATFSGSNSGPMGNLAISGGSVDGKSFSEAEYAEACEVFKGSPIVQGLSRAMLVEVLRLQKAAVNKT
jgi:hypothetical protein